MIEILLLLIVLLLLVSLVRPAAIRNRLESLSRLDGKVDALPQERGVKEIEDERTFHRSS